MKRYLVIVQMPERSTIVSSVVANLGAALRTADAYPNRPSMIISGTPNMLNHARGVLSVPPQKWMTTQIFLSHVYAVSKLFDFRTEIVQNASNWDIKKAAK